MIQFQCVVCKRFLSSKFNLERHMVRHQQDVYRLKCAFCGLACSNEFNYQQHYKRRHADQAPKKPKAVLEPSKCKLHLVFSFFILLILDSSSQFHLESTRRWQHQPIESEINIIFQVHRNQGWFTERILTSNNQTVPITRIK